MKAGLINLIRSVRSFDNTRSETIQFHTPLTLIVGYNGSGKTVRRYIKENILGDILTILDYH